MHSRPRPVRQQGFGLLSFVYLTSIIALSLVVGYSGLLARKVSNELLDRQSRYASEVVAQLEAAWPQFAARLDSPDTSISNVPLADVLRVSGITLAPRAQAEMSSVLLLPGEGLTYRNIVVYLNTETDTTNPPDLDSFRATGEFVSCSDPGQDCAQRPFAVFSSLDIERGLARETQLRLNKVASKAQFYFKARMLQDVEKNIDVNYFRRPNGDCEVEFMDLGCVDTYQPLATVNGMGGLDVSRMANRLGLNDEELFTAWGEPIEVSNLQDSVTDATPFTMSFRARKPDGSYYILKAVQQL